MPRRRNNRPIRTRPPGRRRPVRWIDAFSASMELASPGVVSAGSLTPASTDYTADYRELVVGDLDTEWADANEVVVERLVGDITIRGRDTLSGVETLVQASTAWIGLCTLVRMGIVLVEDVDESPTAINPPSIWEVDDIADGEWMWLMQLGTPTESHLEWDAGSGTLARMWSHDYHLDLRVKRKLGRRDRLVLCHEFVHVGPAFNGEHAVDVQPLLRCLVSTK